MNKILILDNYDSFTYNLVHLIESITGSQVTVARNDKISIAEASAYSRIVLSPGPGIPLEAGIMPELVKTLGPTHRILGVCLGHQCIGEVFGATLSNMKNVVHGKGVETKIINKSEKLFLGLPERIVTGRYHSWIVDREGLPVDLEVTAEDDLGLIMALRHRRYDICGVQFHPESVLTPLGEQIVKNWLE